MQLLTFHTIYFCAEDYVEVAKVSTYDAIPFIQHGNPTSTVRLCASCLKAISVLSLMSCFVVMHGIGERTRDNCPQAALDKTYNHIAERRIHRKERTGRLTCVGLNRIFPKTVFSQRCRTSPLHLDEASTYQPLFGSNPVQKFQEYAYAYLLHEQTSHSNRIGTI